MEVDSAQVGTKQKIEIIIRKTHREKFKYKVNTIL